MNIEQRTRLHALLDAHDSDMECVRSISEPDGWGSVQVVFYSRLEDSHEEYLIMNDGTVDV